MRKVFLDDLPKRGKLINWKDSVGHKVRFVYDDIDDEVKIVDYSPPYLQLRYRDNDYDMRANNFSCGNLGKLVGVQFGEYEFKIGDIVQNEKSGSLKIIDHIRVKNGKTTRKGYICKCLVCNNTYRISEKDLKIGVGCGVCANFIVVKGYNDIHTTNPLLGKLLWNYDDGYKYAEGSSKRLDFKCPNCCNKIKNKIIYTIGDRGLFCPRCSDGISYPEKFFFSFLSQCNVKFLYQLSKSTFHWCGDRRYDFYIPNFNCIIETHGMQHYKESNKFRRNLEEEHKNDIRKKELALSNNIKNYLAIDCSESSMSWIKKSIISSGVLELLQINQSEIDWKKCHEYACSSKVKEVCDLWNSKMKNVDLISRELGLSNVTVIKYLKQGCDIGFCDYNADDQIKLKVICINTKETFDSIVEASKKYNANINGISRCCKGKRLSSGTLNGEPLLWQYLDDYLISPKLNIYKRSSRTKRVICLNTYEIFDSLLEAAKFADIYPSNISTHIKGKQSYAGIHPLTKEPLKWMYL